jgi:hypothetical protein
LAIIKNMIWKDIKNYRYKINENGEVFSLHSNRIIKPCLNKRHQRLQIKLSNCNGWMWKKIHRLVAESFLPNPKNKEDVNHKNGDKLDNRVENLEWCTRKENIHHAIKTGNFGRSRSSTLSSIDVSFIRKNQGIIKQTDLAKKFGVCRGYISKIQLHKKRVLT